jgi:tetratricopeptide (TPR) repeat protein
MEYFHMHTLLHEYTQSILVDPVEYEQAIRSHMRYCVAFAEANPQIDLQKQQRSTFEFEKSYGQLLQALTHMKERSLVDSKDWKDEPELAHQVIVLVDALDHHWQLHSQFDNQVEWLQIAYKCAKALGQAIKQADFARRVSRVLSQQSHLDDALTWMEHCKTALGDDKGKEANAIRAMMHIHTASIQYQQGDLEAAEKDCKQGINLSDHFRDKKDQLRIYAEGYNLLGVIHLGNGELALALEAFEKSLSAWEQVRDQYQIARVTDNISSTYYLRGDFAQARDAYIKILAYWEQFPERIELAMVLANLGMVYECLGSKDLALNLQFRAMQISDHLGVPRIRAMVRNSIAGPCIALEKYAEAETYLNESLYIQTEHGIEEYRVATQCFLAELACGRKFYQQALELAEKALDLAQKNVDPLEEGDALRALGQAYSLNGKLEQARECLETSLSRLRENEYKFESYLTLQMLENLYADLNDPQKAQAAADDVRKLAKEMGLNSPTAASGQ